MLAPVRAALSNRQPIARASQRLFAAMNQGRRQSARPGDYSAKGVGKIPAEVKAMARQMGIPASELANADGMWQKLTKMSEEDPDGYSELLTESAKHMAKANGDELAEGMEPDDAKANELMSKLMTPDALTPAAGYVIKAALKYNGGKLSIFLLRWQWGTYHHNSRCNVYDI